MTDHMPSGSQFRCARCGHVHVKGLPDDEADERAMTSMPGFTPEECVVLCGECYAAMRSPEAPPPDRRPVSPTIAGDIRLLSKAGLQERVAELLTAEDMHVATMGRQAIEIAQLRAELKEIRAALESVGDPPR